MFGPDSAADSLQGRKIVVCPVRIHGARLAQVTGYLASKGLQVIETTAAEHDRQIAVSLALTHFIGRSLGAMQARPQEIDTEGYRRLLRILEVVEHDTWQLFEDMNRFNPHAAEMRAAVHAGGGGDRGQTEVTSMTGIAYRTTGLAVQALTNLSRARVRLHNADAIPEPPAIFVINHFTRLETVLMPYLIHRLTRVPVRMLADAEFFREPFGTPAGSSRGRVDPRPGPRSPDREDAAQRRSPTGSSSRKAAW